MYSVVFMRFLLSVAIHHVREFKVYNGTKIVIRLLSQAMSLAVEDPSFAYQSPTLVICASVIFL